MLSLGVAAINTTAGTASEMTRFCIITNTDTHVKMAIVDWRVTPNVAINDPVLMAGMPPALTAATGMDALTHAGLLEKQSAAAIHVERYTLTPAGEREKGRFCYGHRQVTSVDEFTPAVKQIVAHETGDAAWRNVAPPLSPLTGDEAMRLTAAFDTIMQRAAA